MPGSSTTIKVSAATRDRIREFGGTTYEDTIVDALDLLERERFWAQAAAAAAARTRRSASARAAEERAIADIDAAFDRTV